MIFEVMFIILTAVNFNKTDLVTDYTSFYIANDDIHFHFYLGCSFYYYNCFYFIAHFLVEISFFLALLNQTYHAATFSLGLL